MVVRVFVGLFAIAVTAITFANHRPHTTHRLPAAEPEEIQAILRQHYEGTVRTLMTKHGNLPFEQWPDTDRERFSDSQTTLK